MARPWKVHTQQWMSGKWGFWILAPNNATIAKSCREYTTEAGAVQSAVNLLAAWRTNGIDVVERWNPAAEQADAAGKGNDG